MEVRRLTSAPALQARWLQALLLPAATAACIPDPRGVNLLPLHTAAGRSPGRGAPIGAPVVIDHTAAFWSPASLVLVYLHEMAHALIEEADPDTQHAHDGALACTYASMLMRLDLAGFMSSERIGLWIDSLSIYDFGTPPQPLEKAQLHEWAPRVLSWALRTAGEMIDRGLDGREIATEAIATYSRQVEVWRAEPLKTKARAEAAERTARQLDEARVWIKVLAAGSVVLSGLLVLLVLTR